MNVCQERFLRRVFNNFASLVQSPPFTLPYFKDSEDFFTFMASTQIIELCLFTTTLNILFGESRSHSLTGKKVVKAAHCFEHSAAERIKTINTEAVSFLLCAFCIEAHEFVIWYCSLKIGHDNSFKATVLFCRVVNIIVSESRTQCV